MESSARCQTCKIDAIVAKKDVKLKMDKIKAFIEAVEWHNSRKTIILPTYMDTIQVGVPSNLDEEESDWE